VKKLCQAETLSGPGLVRKADRSPINHMKIAFIVSQFPAISQTFILRQITGLLERGHEVEIFAYSGMTDSTSHADVGKYKLLARTYYIDTYADSPNGIVRVAKRISRLIKNFGKNRKAVLKSLNPLKFGTDAIFLRVFNHICPFLDKGPYDIVHCHFGFNGESGLLLRDLGIFRGKIITTFYGYDISSYTKQRGNDAYNDLFKRGDLFLCVSDRMREKLIKLGCDDRKAVVHRLGIDPRKFHGFARALRNNGRLTILTIARLVEKKGVAYAIHAVAKILRKYPHIEYRIAGDGPLKNELQALIGDLDAVGNIGLIGWKSQEDIGDLLRESDVLLAPSVTGKDGDEEGTPVVIMEALANGLPVLTTQHAGIPEVVMDGESGFLVPERDVDALTEKLLTLIEQPELRAAMGERGRKFVEEHYNIETLNDQLVMWYRQLADGKQVNANNPLFSAEFSANQPSGTIPA